MTSSGRFKLKFSPNKVDTMIVQAIALLDDLDKEINIYSMRVKVGEFIQSKRLKSHLVSRNGMDGIFPKWERLSLITLPTLRLYGQWASLEYFLNPPFGPDCLVQVSARMLLRHHLKPYCQKTSKLF